MKKEKISKFMLFLMLFAFLFPNLGVKNNKAFCVDANNDLKISSKSAILVSFETGDVIYEKNSHERLPIASMTKLASLSIVFSYLDKGLIKENDLVCVSDNAANVSSKAAKVGGSSAFLDAGSKYKVSELIKTVIIASANDSTVALAEYVSGTEEMFVLKMNKLCVELGLTDTHFANATGLPVNNHYSTASDLVKIYKTICDNSLFKKYSKVWMDDFIHPTGRKTELVNTNRLVKTFDGIDGGKTGYTDKAKFCLTASATRGDTRFVGVVIGSNDSKTRFAEMSKLFNYGFANYENKLLVNKDIPLTLHGFKNAKKMVSVYPEENLNKFLPKTENFEFSTGYEIYDLKAPIHQGDAVGKIFVFDKNNMVILETNLIAGESTGEIGFKEQFSKIVHLW